MLVTDCIEATVHSIMQPYRSLANDLGTHSIH